MKSQRFRYIAIALFACILGALAHASISQAVQTRNPAEPADIARPGTDFSGLEARLVSQTGSNRSSGEKLNNALLQKLWDVIDTTDDLSSNEKSDARAILEEADPVLTRIKKDNERAMEILRNPPRRAAPKRPAPAAESETEQAPTAGS